MDLDEELETMEDSAETEAEQIDEVTELQDEEDFEDEGLGGDAQVTDMEDAYEDFYYSEEGPEGEGEFSSAGDGGLAGMDAGETDELGGMGFHIVSESEALSTENLIDAASGQESALRDYVDFAVTADDEEMADDVAALADDDLGTQAIDGIDDESYQGFDGDDAQRDQKLPGVDAGDDADESDEETDADAVMGAHEAEQVSKAKDEADNKTSDNHEDNSRSGKTDDAEDDYEEVELEFDEADIVCYLVDEDDNEIGFTLLDEDGNEVEYYYVEEEIESKGESGETSDKSSNANNPYDLGITKEGVAETTNNMNAIYKDGIAVAAELKDAFDDIKSAFDFKSVLKK